MSHLRECGESNLNQQGAQLALASLLCERVDRGPKICGVLLNASCFLRSTFTLPPTLTIVPYHQTNLTVRPHADCIAASGHHLQPWCGHLVQPNNIPARKHDHSVFLSAYRRPVVHLARSQEPSKWLFCTVPYPLFTQGSK